STLPRLLRRRRLPATSICVAPPAIRLALLGALARRALRGRLLARRGLLRPLRARRLGPVAALAALGGRPSRAPLREAGLQRLHQADHVGGRRRRLAGDDLLALRLGADQLLDALPVFVVVLLRLPLGAERVDELLGHRQLALLGLD